MLPLQPPTYRLTTHLCIKHLNESRLNNRVSSYKAHILNVALILCLSGEKNWVDLCMGSVLLLVILILKAFYVVDLKFKNTVS